MSYEGSGFGGDRPVDGDHKAETNWRLIAGGLIARAGDLHRDQPRRGRGRLPRRARSPMSLWLIIAITTLLGVAVGCLLAGRRHRRRARDRSRLEALEALRRWAASSGRRSPAARSR